MSVSLSKMRSTVLRKERWRSFGIRPKQGQRNDIVAMKEKLDAGQRPLEIAYEDVSMFTVVGQMHRFAETYAQYIRYLIYLY